MLYIVQGCQMSSVGVRRFEANGQVGYRLGYVASQNSRHQSVDVDVCIDSSKLISLG